MTGSSARLRSPLRSITIRHLPSAFLYTNTEKTPSVLPSLSRSGAPDPANCASRIAPKKAPDSAEKPVILSTPFTHESPARQASLPSKVALSRRTVASPVKSRATITFGSPLGVFSRPGTPISTPVSKIAMTTPRPSNAGLALRKLSAPMVRESMKPPVVAIALEANTTVAKRIMGTKENRCMYPPNQRAAIVPQVSAAGLKSGM